MQPALGNVHKSLQDLASRYGKRIRQVQVFDPNVTPYKVTEGYKLDAPPGTVFTRSVKFTLQGQDFEAETSDYYFVLRLKPKGYEGPVFSVNRADRIVLRSHCIQHSHIDGLPVFTSDECDWTLDETLRSKAIRSLVGALQLAKNESLHLFGNGALLYLVSASIHRVESVASTLAQLLAGLDQGSTEHILLPEPFRHLQELADLWCAGDDHDRATLIASASRESLEALWDAVSPLFDDINRYLDSTAAEDDPDSAALLGQLAEAAAEASNVM